MAIGSVIQQGNFLSIRDERGVPKATIPLGGADARLLGYTSTIVSVQRGRFVTMYNEQGIQVGSAPAG